MGEQELKHIKDAIGYISMIHRSGYSSGCLETSATALGGPIDPYNLMLRIEQGGPQFSVRDYLEKHGMRLIGGIRVDETLPPETIEDLLLHPKTRVGRGLGFENVPAVLKGFLVLFVHQRNLQGNSDGSENPDSANHGIAILPRDVLPRDIRRECKKNRYFLIIDAASQYGHYFCTAEGAASMFRDKIQQGYDVAIWLIA